MASTRLRDYEVLDKYFNDLFPTNEAPKLKLWQLLLGTCEEKVHFIVGSGGNGKSVLANIIQDALGDDVARVLAKDLFSNDNTALNGRRFIIVDDLIENLTEEQIQELTTTRDHTTIFLVNEIHETAINDDRIRVHKLEQKFGYQSAESRDEFLDSVPVIARVLHSALEQVSAAH